MTPPHLLPKLRSAVLTDGVRGMPCTLRVSSLFPGYRCSYDDTVVACHLPVDGKGIGSKVTDLAIAAGCSNCHNILDGRDIVKRNFILDHYAAAYGDRLLRALVETMIRQWMAGNIIVRGSDDIRLDHSDDGKDIEA